MMHLFDGFELDGFYLYPDRNAETGTPAFKYFPLEPQPEVDPRHHPTLLFLPMGKTGLLQMGCHLGTSDDRMAILRTALAKRLDLDETMGIYLQPAPLTVRQASLQIGNGRENPDSAIWTEVASSATSGIHPFTALFNLSVNAEQQAAVTSCLNGRRGFLRICYSAYLPGAAEASARIYGDLGAMAFEWKKPGASANAADLHGEAEILLDQALKQGRLSKEIFHTEAASADLIARADNEARLRMIDLIVTMLSEGTAMADPSRAEASARFEEIVDNRFFLMGDVAGWFDGAGPNHILLPSGT